MTSLLWNTTEEWSIETLKTYFLIFEIENPNYCFLWLIVDYKSREYWGPLVAYIRQFFKGGATDFLPATVYPIL